LAQSIILFIFFFLILEIRQFSIAKRTETVPNSSQNTLVVALAGGC